MRSSLMTSAALAAALAFAAPALAQSATQSTSPDPAPKPGVTDSLEQRSAQPDTTTTTGSATSGDTSAQTAAVPVEDLKGMPVHDAAGEKIGEVESATTGSGGALERLVVSQGGFMGLGAKMVAIDGQQAKIEGDRVTLDLTNEQVSELPAYEDPADAGGAPSTAPAAGTAPGDASAPPVQRPAD